jgi:hypothetical protein
MFDRWSFETLRLCEYKGSAERPFYLAFPLTDVFKAVEKEVLGN